MTLPTIEIPPDVLERDYHGAGKAWVAVDGGKVVAIRYMGEFPTFGDAPLPAWINAIRGNAEGLDGEMLPVVWSSRGMARMANAAQACIGCPKPPRRDRYRPKELLDMARAILAVYNTDAFEAHRSKCRADLASLGEVASGMCSCSEFVPHS